jgi:holo-[acyl-carrier protein] synthase
VTLGIGIDIVDVERMTRLHDTPGLAEQLFTSGERSYCSNHRHPVSQFAACFAAKEAFLKASGIALHEGLKFSEIEIVNRVSGQPDLVLHGTLRDRFDATTRCHVSVSHTGSLACAVVALERKGIH